MIIGVTLNGMTGMEAAQTYSLLSIGDGLVSQIPALLISITAGIITTRVSNDSGADSNLGSEISGQIMRQPKALMIASAFLMAMAIVPECLHSIFDYFCSFGTNRLRFMVDRTSDAWWCCGCFR